jgi:hypothetical protein
VVVVLLLLLLVVVVVVVVLLVVIRLRLENDRALFPGSFLRLRGREDAFHA